MFKENFKFEFVLLKRLYDIYSKSHTPIYQECEVREQSIRSSSLCRKLDTVQCFPLYYLLSRNEDLILNPISLRHTVACHEVPYFW